MTTINTNVQSLNAQRNLMASQNSLSTSMQRLSSGLRVNSAKDDAAGLAISERMNAQVKGLNVAARNANDGISLAQTAEGSLGKVGDMVQRIRELAVQSANATNSATDRTSLQAEVVQLTEEIQRVATQTSFNGTKLLDGSFTNQNFQVGANAGETITLSDVANVQLDALGTLQTAASTFTQTQGALTVTDGELATSLQINGVGISIAGAGSRSAGDALTAVVAAFATAKGLNTADPLVNPGLANVTMAANGAITSTDPTLSIAAQTNVTGATAGTTDGTETPGASETGIANVNISTSEGASYAIAAMDTALAQINTSRGTLGAVQSRFENAISNINVTAENLSAARGRIVDADFAKETANLSRSQILQQAGTAMVAQANQLPQGVLSLLR
jgi:flagellin